jgi:hypothetical protein
LINLLIIGGQVVMRKSNFLMWLWLICLTVWSNPLQAQTIHLYKGWNFIAFNYEFETPDDAKLSNFSGIESITAFGYVKNPFTGEYTLQPLSVDSFEPGQAYWVKVKKIADNDQNESPLAKDDSATVIAGQSVEIDVLANDSDADGDSLSITSVTDPAHGTVNNGGDKITYTANSDYNGTDTFTYTISDGEKTATANVTVIVTLSTEDNGESAANETDVELPPSPGTGDQTDDVELPPTPGN